MGDGAGPPVRWGTANIGLRQLQDLPDMPPGPGGGPDPYVLPPVEEWVDVLRHRTRTAVPEADQLRGPAYNAPRFDDHRPEWMSLDTDEMLTCWKDIVADKKYAMDESALVFFGDVIRDHVERPAPDAGKMEGFRIIAHLIKDRYYHRERTCWTNWLWRSTVEANVALEHLFTWHNGNAKAKGKGPQRMMHDAGMGKNNKGMGKNDKGIGKNDKGIGKNDKGKGKWDNGMDYGWGDGNGHYYGYAEWNYKGHGKVGDKGFGKDYGKDKNDDGPFKSYR